MTIDSKPYTAAENALLTLWASGWSGGPELEPEQVKIIWQGIVASDNKALIEEACHIRADYTLRKHSWWFVSEGECATDGVFVLDFTADPPRLMSHAEGLEFLAKLDDIAAMKEDESLAWTGVSLSDGSEE